MEKEVKNVTIGGLLIIILILSFFYWKQSEQKLKISQHKIVYKEKIVTKTIVQKPKGTIVAITLSDLQNDLKISYKHLSTLQRNKIVTAINETAQKRNISPIVIYSLIAVESSFRPWITHRQVVIKGKKDNGIGLGGVIYSWWGKQLVTQHIIETKSDLYDPICNIQAIGYILAELKKLPLKKGTTNQTISALRRYFGANFKAYSDKIEHKIGQIVFQKVYK